MQAKIIIDNKIRVTGISKAIEQRLKDRLIFQNPKWLESFYMLGLSATPYRRDGLTKMIYLYCGDQVYKIETQALQEQNKIMTASLTVRRTEFDYPYNDDYQAMLTELTQDAERNSLIVRDVLKTRNGGISLILSDRKEHCRALYDLLKRHLEVRLLTGDVAMGKRKGIIEELNQDKAKVLVATSQLIGEGFDLKSFSSLFLATPIKFSGKVKQCTGRILRTAKDKDSAVIYDYVDRPGVLEASFRTRLRAYRDLGVKL